MTDANARSRRIHILRDEVSRKIAAGEVIDRPFSIVRELLDNAIDAGARSVDVSLEGGGLGRVRVVDDGVGMDGEDLSLCWLPHATSKIESEDDLLRVASLGFRGEALSSIAVCSRLVIVSCSRDGEPAIRLEVHGGKQIRLDESQGRRGTSVDVSELFFNYPARKRFLRSVSAESGLCRSTFVDRAVAHPGIAFRLFTDGELKLALPAAGPRDRVAAAYSQLIDARLLVEGRQEGEGFAVHVVAGQPELRRRDRKLLQGFVNGRRVTEFALLQAVEFGYSGYMPGGWYPVGFAFVTIDPSLVDFNIHPAKKEVRFAALPEVHRAIVAAVRSFLEPGGGRGGENPSTQVPAVAWGGDGGARGREQAPPPAGELRRAFDLPLEPAPSRALAAADPSIRFLGQVFGVFLVFELPGRLLILDQHAAHERVIYERLRGNPARVQEMLFPLSFDVSDAEESNIESVREEMAGLGIELRRAGKRSWEVTGLSGDFRALSSEKLIELIRGVGGEQWRDSFLATAACRMAIKEGDRVDPVTATELCGQALALPVPRCPHGRPLWHEIPRGTLLSLVDRPID